MVSRRLYTGLSVQPVESELKKMCHIPIQLNYGTRGLIKMKIEIKQNKLGDSRTATRTPTFTEFIHSN